MHKREGGARGEIEDEAPPLFYVCVHLQEEQMERYAPVMASYRRGEG
jgi:hypothetical protein